MLGAAAITLDFSFFGFLASRFPRCSPLAMVLSSGPGRAIRNTSTTGRAAHSVLVILVIAVPSAYHLGSAPVGESDAAYAQRRHQGRDAFGHHALPTSSCGSL